jgi:hypothetical protein
MTSKQWLMVGAMSMAVLGCKSQKADPSPVAQASAAAPKVLAAPPAPKECAVFTEGELGEALHAPLKAVAEATASRPAGAVCVWQQGSGASDLRVELSVERFPSAREAKAKLDPMYSAGGGQSYTSLLDVAEQCVAVLKTKPGTTVSIAWRVGDTVSMLTVERPAGLDPRAIVDALHPLLARKVAPPEEHASGR